MISLTPTRMPESAVPQYWGDIVHAGVICLVIIAAAVTGGLHVIHENTVGNVYTAAIGYAAGRAGSIAHRTFQSRKTTDSSSQGTVDATG